MAKTKNEEPELKLNDEATPETNPEVATLQTTIAKQGETIAKQSEEIEALKQSKAALGEEIAGLRKDLEKRPRNTGGGDLGTNRDQAMFSLYVQLSNRLSPKDAWAQAVEHLTHFEKCLAES